MLIFFWTIVAFSAITAMADSVVSIRIDSPGGSMAQVPLRDQFGAEGDSGICSAVTISQMLDALRYSKNQPDAHIATSPMSLAVIGKTIMPGFPMDGLGFVSGPRLLKHLEQNGLAEVGFEARGPQLRYGFIADLQRSRSIFVDKRSRFSLARSEAKRIARILERYGVISSQIERKIVDLIHKILLSTSAEESSVSFFARLTPALFPPHVVDLSKLTFRHERMEASQLPLPERIGGFVEKVIAKLSVQVPQPIGIEFCRDTLLNPEMKSVTEEGIMTRCNGTDHAAVIVGIEKSGTACQVLIRDSFGDLRRNPLLRWPIDVNPAQIWVGCDALFKNTHSIFWLEL